MNEKRAKVQDLVISPMVTAKEWLHLQVLQNEEKGACMKGKIKLPEVKASKG